MIAEKAADLIRFDYLEREVDEGEDEHEELEYRRALAEWPDVDGLGGGGGGGEEEEEDYLIRKSKFSMQDLDVSLAANSNDSYF